MEKRIPSLFHLITNHWKVGVFLFFGLNGILILFSTARWHLDPGYRSGIYGIGPSTPMKEFEAEYYPFSIQYPEKWIARELPQGNHGDPNVIFGIGVPGRGASTYVHLAHTDTPTGDLEYVAEWGIARKSQSEYWSGYTFINSRTLNSTRLNGISHEYLYTSEGPFYGHETIRCLDWYICKNQDGYALSFCANQEHWEAVYPVFLKMIDSFSVE